MNAAYEYHAAEAERFRQEALALPWYAMSGRRLLTARAWDHTMKMMDAMLPDLVQAFRDSPLSL